MNSLRLRIIFPLTLFGFLPALGVVKLLGHSFDWFASTSGALLGGGVFLIGYLLSGWVLKPTTAVMKATASVLRGLPPDAKSAEWIPADFWRLRCDINMLFSKHRQALNAAESHACQTAQRLLRAERLLREAFTALQGIFAASDEGVAVVDAEGTIIASNTRLDEFLGKPLEEVAGRDAVSFLGALSARFADTDAISAWLAAAQSNPEFHDQIEADLGDTSRRVFSIRTSPMRTDTGDFIGRLWMIRDCSEVRILKKQLRQSQKLGTLGQIAGGIAHDFNNLLTAIRGNLTLAEIMPGNGKTEVRERIESASQASARAAELVKQLLGYSRGATGVLVRRSTNIKKMLADVQNLLRHSLDPRITVRVRAGMDASFVNGDETQLQQVLLNLCLNARDAVSPENGIIEIGLENVTHRPPTTDGTAEPREFAMVVVRDNGRGISEEDRLRIFEPFFTTKENGKGTGLGLSMAQEIVQEHGGWIEFDSVTGQGTEFRIFLPRVADPENVEEAPAFDLPPPASVTPGLRGTVLVVDDEAPVRAIAVNMLNFLGYRVLEAGDGQQALDIVFHSGEKIDAMLLDIYMPKLSGRDTFKQMRATGCDMPVVVCSGFVIDPDEFVILGEGRNPPVDIMLKPYTLDGLNRAMTKAVKLESSVPDQFTRPLQPVMAS